MFIPLLVAFVVGICILVIKFINLKYPVNWAVSLPLAIIYMIGLTSFLLFLAGLTQKKLCLILSIHYCSLYIILLICALIDYWTPLHTVPQLIYWPLTIIVICGTMIYDWKLWPAIFAAVIINYICFWYTILDGMCFWNGVYPNQQKHKGWSMASASFLSAHLTFPIGIIALATSWAKNGSRVSILPR